MIRLSIIVPFYNVEKYIEQCIRSLYDQDIPHDEYEVICVDDCSPDGSRGKIEELRVKNGYTNLTIICHERNKKLGGARNTGLRAAKGEYIWYVDSDDYITPNCLASLLKDAEKNDVDMLQFDYQTVVGNVVRPYQVSYEDKNIYTGAEFVVDESHARWFLRIPMAWLKLHKRKFLLENSLWFVEDAMYEDTDLSLFMFTLAKRVKHINLAPYCYRNNSEAVTKRKRTAETMMYTILQQHRCIRAFMLAPTPRYKNLIETYLRSQLTQLRVEIKSLSNIDKLKFAVLMAKHNIFELKEFCNWRTWLAIKFGITIFVK